jgi:CO/xanthine dehydrogenase FAD-binding subunit
MLREFEYIKPSSMAEAIDLIGKYGTEAVLFAGGTDLVIGMRAGDIRPKYVIDIKKVSDLGQIKQKDGKVSIGSSVVWSALGESEIIEQNLDLLNEVLSVFASPQIANWATVGGNLCTASPSCDMGPPLLVLNARLIAIGKNGERDIPVSEFFLDRRTTALESDEILKELQIDLLPKDVGAAFEKVRRTGVDIAIVNAAAAVKINDNKFEEVKIALGGVAPTPIRAIKCEEKLKGKSCTDENIELAASEVTKDISPISDVRASAEYRIGLSKALVKRTIKNALNRVGG